MASWKIRKRLPFQSWMRSYELNENLKATKVKKISNFVGKHASLRVYVIKKLFKHNYGFLGKDGGKNHQPFRSW